MKLLKTINTDVAMYCQHQFGFKLQWTNYSAYRKIHSENIGFRLCI